MEKLTALDVFVQLEEAINFDGTQKLREQALRKKAIELIPFVGRDTAAAAITPITAVKEPIVELERRAALWRKIDDCRVMFLLDNKDGMIITNDTVYPVSIDIDLENQEDCTWALDNERTLVAKVAESFVVNMGVESFEGHVMLFVQRGFSGDMKYVTSYKKEPAGQAVNLKSLFSTNGLRKRKGAVR